MRSFAWLVLAVPVALAACTPEPKELTVERAIVRLSPNPAAPSVAYFTIKGGPVADRLIAVSSPVVIRTEMHESMTAGGMASMKPITSVPIPANATVTFEEGGKHAMLFNVNPGIKPDEAMALVFTFASGDKLQIQASVRRPGQVL